MTKSREELNVCRSVVPHKDPATNPTDPPMPDDNDKDGGDPSPPPSTVAIKSQTVVKLQTFQSPASFARLQCNTDLNTPPSNWLTNSANSYGLQQALSHSTGFTSFRMAHMFPDCLGEIDVVSSAESIKKLLKLPYSAKSGISLMIHRIENTLLIDEFDIHKYLLRQADDDWQWLKSFMCEHLLGGLGDAERRMFLKNKSREALQQRSLQSKFLYHSLTGGEATAQIAGDEQEKPHQQRQLTKRDDLTPSLAGPLLPDPSVDETEPDPHRNHTFNRNVVWTFEDIRMLIGTDMPIFGSANRPCISLRLRDQNQPINVLTGIDYWLDNLMCNVPEVVMCYHLDGLVQKYELIPTEDLPNLENSKFSPKVIRNVAQNILAFLKQNATKAGHTYWLFKGRNDDFVKLYDLTSLCMNAEEQETATASSESASASSATSSGQKDTNKGPSSSKADNTAGSDAKDENPFTVPVAMLLYKVARNMKNMAQHSMSAKQAGSIKTLLDNCIQLLPKEKYPQIVTSSHYILSDLHVPASINPNAPNFAWSPDEPDGGDDDLPHSDTQSHSDGEEHTSTIATADLGSPPPPSSGESVVVATKNISDTLHEFHLQPNWKHNASPPPIGGNVRERCEIALQHIVEGLGCLQYFSSTAEKLSQEKAEEEERQRIRTEEQNPQMANARQAIPLPYETLRPEAKRADARIAIPMGWKQGDPEATTAVASGTPKPGRKSKKQRRKSLQKAMVAAVTPAPTTGDGPESDDSPRSLLLGGKSGVIESWHVHLKLLLLEKACLTYATLTEQAYTAEQYADALRYIQLAMQCQLIVTKYMSSVSSQKLCLLGRAGDCYFQLAKAMAAGLADVLAPTQSTDDAANVWSVDTAMRAELANDLAGATDATEMAALLPEPSGSVEELMVRSCACYERALVGAATFLARREFVSRLGSVRNELGVKYMHWAQQEYARYLEVDGGGRKKVVSADGGADAEPLYQLFIRKSYDCLVRGIGAFEEIEDNANLAILMCNMGRFMRFRAHVILIGESNVDIGLKRTFYDGAFTSYHRALGILETRKRNPVLWDLVNWELSTGTFTLAQHIIDNTPADGWTDSAEQEIIELLLTALKLSDTETPGERQVLYAFRQGLVYHRLAGVYARAYRRCGGDAGAAGVDEGQSMADATRRKKLLQLARMYYEKAARALERLEQVREFVLVQNDRLALQEHLTAASNTNNAKIRHLQYSLDILRQSAAVLTTLVADAGAAVDATLNEMLDQVVRQLQTALRTMIKLCMGQSQPQQTDAYKRLYSLTLCRENVTEPGGGAVAVLCRVLQAMPST